MKEFKGTPGPWVRESTGRGIGPVSTDDDQSYGMVIPVAYVDFGESDEVQNSNAKLIAAAPELLESLQLILSSAYEIEHDFYGLHGGEDFDISQVIKDAQSAINKALGE